MRWRPIRLLIALVVALSVSMIAGYERFQHPYQDGGWWVDAVFITALAVSLIAGLSLLAWRMSRAYGDHFDDSQPSHRAHAQGARRSSAQHRAE